MLLFVGNLIEESCYLFIEVRDTVSEERRNVYELVTTYTHYQSVTDYQTTTETRGIRIFGKTVYQSLVIDYHHSLRGRQESERASADVALHYVLIGLKLRGYIYQLYWRACIDSKCFHCFLSFLLRNGSGHGAQRHSRKRTREAASREAA